MAISRSLMNRQLRANGGIMQVAPREKFGLGSKLKDFVRKIIPNEIADIAVKAAPFVAPFNPAVGAAMSGLGRFDQTGSIGDSLKGGALTYGLGQGARYLGGAGFQGNPFASGGAFTPSGFTQGFSSPLGSDTGLGKFFSNRGTSEVQAVQDLGTSSERSYLPFQSEEMKIPTYSEQLVDIQKGSPNQMTITQSIQKILNPTSTMEERGNEALNLLKRGTKAAFTKTDANGNTVIDKAAVIGAVTFAASYAEAKALANDAGVELTEEAYDEAKKADKKEEYAGYLTNFFGGRKDGGRIGFESGANEMIKTQLLEEIMPNTDTTTEDYVIIMTEDGPRMILKSNLPSESMMMDTTTSVFGDAGRGREIPQELRANGGRIGFSEGMDEARQLLLAKKYTELLREYSEAGLTDADSRAMKEANEFVRDIKMADGGRIGFKKGSPEEPSEVGIMAIDVEAGDDEDEEDMMMAGITFSRPEKSYLFRKLGGAGGADRSFTMPQLYRILNNPNRYPDDAAVLKEIAIMGLGGGRKDGGRIGLKGGGTDKMEQYKKYVSDMIKDGETPVDFEEFLEMTNYKDGGRIGFSEGSDLMTLQVKEMWEKEGDDDPLGTIVKMGLTFRAPIVDLVKMIGVTASTAASLVADVAKLGYDVTEPIRDVVSDVAGGIYDVGKDLVKGSKTDTRFIQPLYYLQRFGPEKNLTDEETQLKMMSDSVGRDDPKKRRELENIVFGFDDAGMSQRPEDKEVSETIKFKEEFAKGGRIGLKGGSGSSNRVAQLILERDYLLSKDEDVSYIDAELESLGYKMKSEGGVMDVKMPTGKIRKNNAGVVERDYRDEGGFVPVGIKERADDVPAMLSKNEFVMTADAVRGIGNGSVEEGSKRLYNTMKQAEKVGKA